MASIRAHSLLTIHMQTNQITHTCSHRFTHTLYKGEEWWAKTDYMVNETCLPWIAASFLLWPAETSHRSESDTSVSQLISCVLETRMQTGTDCQQVRRRSFIWLDDVEQWGAPLRAELSPILLTVYSFNMRTAYWMMSCCFFSYRYKFNLQTCFWSRYEIPSWGWMLGVKWTTAAASDVFPLH